MPILRSALHAAALGYMAWGWNALLHLKGPLADLTAGQYGGHWAFLTILGLWGTMVTVGLSLAADLTGLALFKRAKRVLLLIALPVETVVSSIYWPLILFAPKLMMPGGPEGDASVPGTGETELTALFIPLPMDFALHLTPALILLVDFFYYERAYGPPASSWGAGALAAVCGLAYGSWAEWCASHNAGTFAYPFLTIAPFRIRCAIYAGATGGALLFFWVLNGVKRGRGGR